MFQQFGWFLLLPLVLQAAAQAQSAGRPAAKSEPLPKPFATPSTVKHPRSSAGRKGRMPHPPSGFRVTAFARDIESPRWIYVLPNGDVLVAQSRTLPKPKKEDREERKGRQGEGRGHEGVEDRHRHLAEQDHAAPRRRRRRQARGPRDVPGGPQPAVRHGAGRRTRSTSPTPTRSWPSRTRRARRRIEAKGDEGAGPAGRRLQQPLDPQRRRQPATARSCTSPSAPPATSPSTARPRRCCGPTSWK